MARKKKVVDGGDRGDKIIDREISLDDYKALSETDKKLFLSEMMNGMMHEIEKEIQKTDSNDGGDDADEESDIVKPSSRDSHYTSCRVSYDLSALTKLEKAGVLSRNRATIAELAMTLPRAIEQYQEEVFRSGRLMSAEGSILTITCTLLSLMLEQLIEVSIKVNELSEQVELMQSSMLWNTMLSGVKIPES